MGFGDFPLTAKGVNETVNEKVEKRGFHLQVFKGRWRR
jgi:hypothetical protein